jgi:hypothetical protein
MRVLLGVGVCVALVAAAWPIGMLHAEVSNLMGSEVVLGFGLCNGPCGISQQILRDRYGIQSVPIAGCSVLGPEVLYAEGFNVVARRAIIRRHGHDVFQEAHDEAVKVYVAKRRGRDG